MNAPVKVPFAVLRAVVKHSRTQAISYVSSQCSGLREAMRQREPDWRDMVGGDGKPLMDPRTNTPFRIKCYGQSEWRGVAWKQTDEHARATLSHLRWSGDHYSFSFAGMYVGIELDGYMHT